MAKAKQSKSSSRNKSGLMGGAREGAGRPAELTKPERLVALVDGHLVKYLDKVQKKQGLTSRAAAVRWLLDTAKYNELGLE